MIIYGQQTDYKRMSHLPFSDWFSQVHSALVSPASCPRLEIPLGQASPRLTLSDTHGVRLAWHAVHLLITLLFAPLHPHFHPEFFILPPFHRT